MCNSKFFKKPISALAVFLIVHFNYGQNEAQPLETFLGTWHGEGTLFNGSATFKMVWEKDLGYAFYKLTFENEFLDSTGKKTHLQAVAYYKPTDENRFTGFWFDSRGMILPLQATFNKGSLETIWGNEQTERGKTVYTFKNDGTAMVKDYILKSGLSMQFGDAQYKKANE